MTTIATSFSMVLGQLAAAATPPSAAPGGTNIWIPMMVIMGIWLFFSFNSKRKQDKQRQALLGSMKRGDRVLTIGGIIGTIVDVRDTEIVVKVDESNNTKIKFTRSSITRVVTDEEKVETK